MATIATATPMPILFAVRAIPIEAFGSNLRQTRKFVLMTLATHADADGSNCFPGKDLLSRECGLSVRGLHKVISWLEDHSFIRADYKTGPKGTSRYFFLIPDTRNSSGHSELYS